VDEHRFDHLTRALGKDTTRRGLLGGVAGLAALGLAEAAAKRRKRKKRRNRRNGSYRETGQVQAEIRHGELDGDDHPYVGIMVAQGPAPERAYLHRCSGTLLSPRIFLTAGHCVEPPADRIEIWFDATEEELADNGFPINRESGAVGDVGGEPITHPDFDPDAFYLHDLGVVFLDDDFPSPNGVYGTLPALDQLDPLGKKRGQNKVTFTAVGYGLQRSFPDAASEKDQAVRDRMVAHPKLVQINTTVTGDYSILLSNNAHTGGTCFGDSGGPNFVGDTTVIGGVTSYGRNDTCAGTGGVYRVDRADDLDWLCGTFGDQLPGQC
jgi:hypothetical protein